jgi:hypothetical protein
LFHFEESERAAGSGDSTADETRIPFTGSSAAKLVQEM